MKGKHVFIGVFLFIALVVIMLYSSLSGAKHKVEVCIEFNGRTNCRTASGSTREFALRTATANACATIAGGVGDTIACENRQPKSVKWIE